MISLRFPLLALVSIATPALASAFSVSDGTFAAADWTHEVRFDSGFISVTESVGQSPSGGAPGAYRQIGYAMAWAGTQTYGSVYVISRYTAAAYSPAALGAIGSISYDEDQTRVFADWSPALVAGNPVIFQAGKTYLGPNFVFGPNDLQWAHHAAAALTATDFVELSGMNVLTDSHPDFSASAPDLGFGYSRSNSYSFSSSLAHGIDNWSFSIASVPEPAAAPVLAGLAALGLGVLRRRRAPSKVAA